MWGVNAILRLAMKMHPLIPYPGKEGFMPQWALTVIVILAVVAIAEAAWILSQRRRSDHQRRCFGPEYMRTVEERGNHETISGVVLGRLSPGILLPMGCRAEGVCG
jgi:hypothetical protein